jgi:hypothetical protein
MINSVSFNQMGDPGKSFSQCGTGSALGWMRSRTAHQLFELGFEQVSPKEFLETPFDVAISSMYWDFFSFTLPKTRHEPIGRKSSVSDGG